MALTNEDWIKPFKITSICREDLRDQFSDEEIETLTDADMKHIASKMVDAYCENSFWIDMKIIVDQVLDDKKSLDNS